MTTRIIESVRVAEAPEALWREIGSFGAVGKWHPLLARVDCEGERSGCRRTAEGQDGSRQIERLLETSPRAHFYRYRMESSGMPVRDYVGELRVESDGDSGSNVVWSAEFEAAGGNERKVAQSVLGFFKAGLHNLERLHRGSGGEGLADGHGDFETFFESRMRAAEAYTNGEYALLAPLVAGQGEASFHSPGGDTVSGVQAVAERYRKDAGSFQAGGKSRFEILQKGTSGELGFWTGFQVATVIPASGAAPVEMRIRVTEVFRNMDGQWKLVHRHADLGKSPGKTRGRNRGKGDG